MSLFSVTLVVAGLYAVVSFLALPIIEQRWKDAGIMQKIGRSGVLAGLKTLQTFLQIALIVFGVSMALTWILQLVAPVFGASLLVWLHGRLTVLDGWIGSLRDGLGIVMTWIAIIALAGFAWRARRGHLIDRIRREYELRFDKIVELAGEQGLEVLPADERMRLVAGQIAQVDDLLAALGNDVAQAARRAELGALRERLERNLLIHDIGRRIDLTDLAIDDERSRGIWPRIRLALTSKGAQAFHKSLTLFATRAATALACFLVIGASAPTVAAYGVTPSLDRLAELQISRSQQAALQSLRQLLGQRATQSNPADDAIYHQAAQQFVNSIAQVPQWQTAVVRSHPSAATAPNAAARDETSLHNLAVRDTILREFAQSNAAGLQVASPGAFDGAATEAERGFDRYRETAFAARPAAQDPVDKVAAWLRAAGERSPAFRERLRASLAAFGEPAPVWDFASALIGDELSQAIGAALPDPREAGLFEKNLTKPGRKVLSKALERVVQIKLADFMNDIGEGRGMAAALAGVRAANDNSAILRTGEAADLNARLAQIDADRGELIRTAPDHSPTLLQPANASQRDAAEKILANIHIDRSDLDAVLAARSNLAGSFGTYDDLFPGSKRAAGRSPLAHALSVPVPADVSLPQDGQPSGFGPPPGPMDEAAQVARAEESAITRVVESRSFVKMARSVRVGGVLIGSAPTGGRLPARALSWRRNGTSFALTLVLADDSQLPLGSYRGSLIQQALAYAADGRPVSATMTSSPLTAEPLRGGGFLRVQVHPALVNTRLGREIVDLDRFADESEKDRDPRAIWENRVNLQIELYNQAARLLRGGYEGLGDPVPPARHDLLAAFPTNWAADKPDQSVFAYYSTRFDSALVRALRGCASGAPAGFWQCVESRASQGGFVEQPFHSWSGVRETPYRIQPQAFFAGSGSGTAPLRFMLQVAFEQEQDNDPPVWEFPILGNQVQASVERLVATRADHRQILADARQFAALQRVFRAALNGGFGAQFSQDSLVALMREARAADPIVHAPTPQWSVPRGCAAQLRDVVAGEFAAIAARFRIMLALSQKEGVAQCAAAFGDGKDPMVATTGKFDTACQGVIRDPVREKLREIALSHAYITRLINDPAARFAGEACPAR